MTRLRRLSNAEIANISRDLLGVDLQITRGFLDESRVEGYDNDATALVMSDSKLEEFGVVAERIAGHISDPKRINDLAPCPASEASAACGTPYLRGFARRAWGRDIADAEATRLYEVYQRGGLDGGHAGGVALVTEAIVLSPHFIYQTELGPAAPDAGSGPNEITLTGTEIANALSFLLRGSRPDEALLTAGLQGHLLDPEARKAQVRRLLGETEGRRQLARFVRAWLHFDDVTMINKDVNIFPEFTPALKRALDRELTAFLDHVLPRGRLVDLVFADFTFASPAHVPIYGPGELTAAAGDFTKVGLGPQRRGLLTSPAFLARHALVNQSNPVERGLIVRNQLFCQDVPPPPPELGVTAPIVSAETTTRKKYEAHLSQPSCHGCHKLIDGLGFGFEAFDGIGRHRTTENGHAVDASGEIIGTDVDGSYVGAVALLDRVRKSHLFRRCFVQQLWRSSYGRAIGPADKAEIDWLAYDFHKQDDVAKLVEAMVARPNFITRRSAEAP